MKYLRDLCLILITIGVVVLAIGRMRDDEDKYKYKEAIRISSVKDSLKVNSVMGIELTRRLDSLDLLLKELNN